MTYEKTNKHYKRDAVGLQCLSCSTTNIVKVANTSAKAGQPATSR